MPEKAVCDSSVLINFAKAKKLGLLTGVFTKPLFVPQEVYHEAVEVGIENKESDALVIRKSVEGRLICVMKTRKAFQHPFLDAGEKSVISLALQEKIKSVCFDESPARNAAKQLAIKPIGSLGIIQKAVELKLISRQQALDLLEGMVKRDYRISAKILEEFKSRLKH